MKFVKIIKEPVLTRWYSGRVGDSVEYVPRYDDEELYGIRDDEGYINFVVKTDAEIVEVNW